MVPDDKDTGQDSSADIVYLDSDMSDISLAVIVESYFEQTLHSINRLKANESPGAQHEYTSRQPAIDELAGVLETWRSERMGVEGSSGLAREQPQIIDLDAMIKVFEILKNNPELYVTRSKDMFNPYYNIGSSLEFLLSRLSAQHHSLVPRDSTVEEQLEFLYKLKFGKLAPPASIPDRDVVWPEITIPDQKIGSASTPQELQRRLDEELAKRGEIASHVNAAAQTAASETPLVDDEGVEFLDIQASQVELASDGVAATTKAGTTVESVGQASPRGTKGSDAELATLLDERVQKPAAISKTEVAQERLAIAFDSSGRKITDTVVTASKQSLQSVLSEILDKNPNVKRIMVVSKDTDIALYARESGKENSAMLIKTSTESLEQTVASSIQAFLKDIAKDTAEKGFDAGVRKPVITTRLPGVGVRPSVDSDLGASSDIESSPPSPRSPRA